MSAPDIEVLQRRGRRGKLKLEKNVGSKSVPYGERTKRGDQVKKSVDIHGEREKRSADTQREHRDRHKSSRS